MKEAFDPKVCLAILNYNGREHLTHLLPTVLEAVANYNRPCPIVLLDNRSPDGDVAWISLNYPQVQVEVAPNNDFLFSYNWLLAKRDEDIIILLNNDLRLSDNFVSCLVRHFVDAGVFAVSCKAYNWNGDEVNSGPCFINIQHRGWVVTGFLNNRQVLSYTLFSSGGFMAVDRRKFIAVGGFDRLYHPAYGEDKDLCFRAWTCGWKSLYDPECHVFHREGGSWDQQSNRSKRMIDITNYLFMWRNFRALHFRIPHRVYLFWLSARKRIEGDTGWSDTLKEARQLWQDRRRLAIRNGPQKIDLHYLQRICGAPL